MENATRISVKHISWGAIIAGVIIALALESLLNLLGLGLGFTAFTVDADVIANIGIGSIIWILISGIFSMFVGGWIAGRSAGINLRLEGILHGFIAWGLATLITFFLMATTVGALVSGMTNVIGQGISLAGQGATTLGRSAAQIAPQMSEATKNLTPNLNPAMNKFIQQANQLIAKPNENNAQTPDNISSYSSQSPDTTKTQLQQAVIAFLTATNANDAITARHRLINLLEENADMDQVQAEQTVNDWQQDYSATKQQIMQKAAQAKQQAITATEETSNALGKIAIITFVAFLTSAIASCVGGMLGTIKRNITTNYLD